jgi:hypothetical protein
VARGGVKVVAAESHGEPAKAAQQVLPSLFQTAYRLKFSLKGPARKRFHVGPLAARWPIPGDRPKEEWVGLWALPVPASTRRLPTNGTDMPVRLETWDYGGRVAEILHVGPWSEEKPTIDRLHAYIREQGYEIAGAHEEEYLTTPKAKIQKTIIRYPVRRA